MTVLSIEDRGVDGRRAMEAWRAGGLADFSSASDLRYGGDAHGAATADFRDGGSDACGLRGESAEAGHRRPRSASPGARRRTGSVPLRRSRPAMHGSAAR